MQKNVFQIIVGLIIVGALVYGVVTTFYPSSVKPIEETSYIIQSIKNGSFTSELPPLDYEVEFTAEFPDEPKAEIINKITETQYQLRKYPYDGTAWTELGLLYHTANDFPAAENVWLFLVDAEPANITALGNLGRLYHFEYKDFPKAEEYFKKAIEANPDRKEAYFDLFDLYRYSYKKDTTAAVDIMKVGAERFPDDINFPAALGTYYRDSGRPNQARAQFEKALSMARTMGDINLIQNFTNELSRL